MWREVAANKVLNIMLCEEALKSFPIIGVQVKNKNKKQGLKLGENWRMCDFLCQVTNVSL